PCGPPNCSSSRLARAGLGSLTRTVYCSRLLWVNMDDSLSIGGRERGVEEAGSDTAGEGGRVGGASERARCGPRMAGTMRLRISAPALPHRALAPWADRGAAARPTQAEDRARAPAAARAGCAAAPREAASVRVRGPALRRASVEEISWQFPACSGAANLRWTACKARERDSAS